MTTSRIAQEPRAINPQIDMHTGQTTVACPACGEGVTYHPRTVRCPGCGWAVALSDKEAFEWFGALMGFNATDPGLFLKVKHASTCPPPEPPPKVISHGPAAEHKAQVLPDENERPLDRLTRLADQAELNGCEGRQGTDLHTVEVSSQRRDAENQTVTWYTIEQHGGVWRCSCQAGDRAICAHRAWLWRHYDVILRDPDQKVWPPRRAMMERIYLMLMRQAGCVAPVAPAPPRDRAAILARADAAMADLFGSGAT